MFAPRKEMERPVLETGKGLTKQSFTDETNINLIMRKAQKTGLVSFVNKHQGEYMDAPEMDFQEAMNYVNEANQMFLDMPAKLRKQFDNDAGKFLDYVHDPQNEESLYEMGLAIRPTEVVVEASEEAPTETE